MMGLRTGILAMLLVACAAVASAQTVTVIGAPAGGTIEVIVENQALAPATADARGTATVTGPGLPREIEARLYVEVCDAAAGAGVHRIRLQSAAVLLPPVGACTRRDAGALFQVATITTFVVDVAGSEPLVRVRQGSAPAAWLTRLPAGQALPARDWDVPAPGLVLSAGGGLVSGGRFSLPQCGDVEDCSRSTFRPVYNAAATVWLARFLGAQGSYTRSTDVKAEGGGTGFDFSTATRLETMNVAANIGGPIGVTRLYGIGGATFHRTRTRTSQTVAATATTAGGSQQFELKTEGWGLLYGGGLEVWASSRLGFYAEVTRSKMKADDLNGGEGGVDTNVPYAVVGIRLNLFP